MDENQFRKLEDLIANGYHFPIREYIREGWELYKSKAGYFIGFFFITLFISMSASIIPVVGWLANSLVLSPALGVGFFLVAHKIKNDQKYEFGNFFDGFKLVVPLMLQALILMVIMLVALSPSIYVLYESGIVEWYMEVLANPLDPPTSFPEPDTRMFLTVSLNMFPLVYLGIAYMWANQFIVFFNAGAWEGLEMSRRLITKKWFSVFGLVLALAGILLIAYIPAILLTALSPVVGVIILVVLMLAIIFVVPAFYTIMYTAFADVTGLNEEEENEDILAHLIE